MTDEQSGYFSCTKAVPLAFADRLITPAPFKDKKGKEKGEPKFGFTAVFDPESDDWKNMKKTAVAIAKAKDPEAVEKIKSGEIKLPFKSGDKLVAKTKANFEAKDKEYKGQADYMLGKGVIGANSKFQPKLGILDDGKLHPEDKALVRDGILELETDAQKQRYKGRFFPGVESFVEFNFVWYDGVDDGKPGVTAYPNSVLVTGKGKRLGGGRSVTETFKGYAGKVSNEDPTAGEDLDDEIPF